MKKREDRPEPSGRPERPCPICGKPAAPEASTYPFCSRQCRLIDLGKWLQGGYRSSRPLDESDLDEV